MIATAMSQKRHDNGLHLSSMSRVAFHVMQAQTVIAAFQISSFVLFFMLVVWVRHFVGFLPLEM